MLNDKKRSNSKDSDLKKAPLPPIPFKQKKNLEEDAKIRAKKIEVIMAKEGPMTVKDAELIIEDMAMKREAMQNALDEISKRVKSSPEHAKTASRNPSRFQPEVWRAFQEFKEEFLSSLPLSTEEYRSLARQEGLDTHSIPSGGALADKNKDASKKRRRGPRTTWLPMR